MSKRTEIAKSKWLGSKIQLTLSLSYITAVAIGMLFT